MHHLAEMSEVRMIVVIFLTGYVMKLRCAEIFLRLNDNLDDKSLLKAVVSDTGVPIKNNPSCGNVWVSVHPYMQKVANVSGQTL